MKRNLIIQKAITLMLIIGAFTCMASVSMAATYYVSTTGNDSNNGTATTTPFKTIQKSLNTVRPGDTVNIMSGTYYEGLVINTSGSSTARITIQPYNTGTVTISSGTSRAVKLNISNGGYYTFSHLNFTSTHTVYDSYGRDYSVDLGMSGPGWWGYGPAMAATPVMNDSSYSPNMTMGDSNGYNGFIVEYCNITGSIGFQGHNNIVRYCNLEGNETFKNGIADVSIVSHHNLYTHNNVHGMVNRGFWLMDNISYEEVSYNKIWNDALNSTHTGVDFDCVPLPGHNNLIKGNVSYNQNIAYEFENQFNGVMDGNITYSDNVGLEAIAYGADQGDTTEWRTYAQNNLIKNNIAYGCGTSAISIICSRNNWIINNTLDGNSASQGAIGMPNQGTTYSSNNTYIANNIITNNSTGIMNQGGTGVTITNNLFYGNSNNGTMGASYQNTDPLYTNRSNHDYTVPASSPAVDHGTTPTTTFNNPYGDAINISVLTDFTGTTTRPQGSAYDIGAYEFGTATASSVSPSAPSSLTIQ